MLEQMRGLFVDLERIVLVEQVEIEGLSHTPGVYYNRIPNVDLSAECVDEHALLR